MYEERKEKFSFKSFFLTLLLVLLFIFLLLWIFPNKGYIDKKLKDQDTVVYDLDRLSVLYDEIFANNVARMKDAAIGYFTNERMPKTVGETKRLTLKEMYDLHLVLKMKDKDGKECDVNRSYVEMTKYTEEYRLKVNLSCGDQEDYIIVYLGCYSYCPTGVCEKTVPTPSKTTAKEEQQYGGKENTTPTKYSCKVVNGTYYDKNGNVVSKTEYDKSCNTQPEPTKYSCKVVNGKYYDKNGNVVSKTEYDKSCNTIPVTKKEYEYKLVVEGSTSCTNWSNWQKQPVTATSLVKVETKTEKELSGYKKVEVPVTKTETIKKQVTEKYIAKTITKLVIVGTKEVQVGTTKKTVTEKVETGKIEVATGKIGTGTVVPQNTSTTHYKVLSTDTRDNCSYCENKTMYTWEEYSVQPVYDVKTITKDVPVYKTINVYESKEVPVYDFRTVEKEEKVTKTIIETKEVPEYKDVTYYRYMSCTVTPGYTDIKWSASNTDSTLINKGYKLTGNVREV